MHACGLDPVDRADGARKLAFERPELVDVLDKGRGAERVGLVEDLVADAAALGQPVLGELHAQPRHSVLRHQDDGAVILDVIDDRLAVEVLGDGGGIVERQVGEQRHHLWRRHPHHEKRKEADERQRHRDHGGQTRGTQRLHESEKTLHRRLPTVARRASRLTRQVLPSSWLASG
jgi:hypothetical protein